jgi:prefoldin beta subunit
MADETQEKIGKLQMLEQSMQTFLMQKQQFQAQLIEIESALKELKDAKTVYKITGNIMIDADKASLEKDLQEKKEKFELRIKTLEKQEAEIKKKATSMQAEVMEGLEKTK